MSNLRKTAAQRYLGHAANDLFWFILPLVLPLLLLRYKLSYAQAGGILTFYLTITAFASYVMGRVSDGIPRRYIMGFGFFIAAGGLIASGFVTTFPVFMMFLAITALGVSTFHPAMYAHIDETFKEKKSRVLGVYEASGSTAIFVMFIVNGALIDSIGIRGVMIITAMPALIMGTLLLRSRGMDQKAPENADSSSTDLAQQGSRGHVPLILFVLFLLSIVLRFTSVMAVVNFLPTIFKNHFGLSTSRAAAVTGLFFAGGILGSLAATRFSRTQWSYKALIYGASFLAALIFLLSLGLPMSVNYLLVFVLGSFASGLLVNQNLILTTLGSRFGRGEAFGIMMAATTLAQSFGPALFGLSVDRWGFSMTLLLFSMPVLLSAALLMALFRPVLGLKEMKGISIDLRDANS